MTVSSQVGERVGTTSGSNVAMEKSFIAMVLSKKIRFELRWKLVASVCQLMAVPSWFLLTADDLTMNLVTPSIFISLKYLPSSIQKSNSMSI